MSNHPACQPVSDTQFNVLSVTVERLDLKFQAKLHIILRMPFTREVNVAGPLRETRPEAIKDGIELGKRYVIEGEAGAKTVALRLKKKRWTASEVKDADEQTLSEFVLPGLQGNQSLQPVQQKLLPPGEGWARYNDDMLVHTHSHIYFVQTGSQAGQYLKRSCSEKQEWDSADAPHLPEDHPIALRTASASSVRRGGKLDRAVLLNDVTKIARLACKIPLTFVDRPACACALFQGLRSSESAQWCAENFHKKLLPRLADKIQRHGTVELEEILRKTLQDMDAELLRSQHAFSGCTALIALLLGDRLVVAGVGQVRALLLPERGTPEPLLVGTGDPSSSSERERIRQAGGVVRTGCVHGRLEDLDEVSRILSARHVFDVLMLGFDGPFDERDARSSYRRLALRVHPDKQAEQIDGATGATREELEEGFKRAFARLESAKDELEAMLRGGGEDGAATCHELCRILRSEVHTRAGAATLLGVDKAATLDTEAVAREAERASKDLIGRIAGMKHVAADLLEQAVHVCQEAVETLRRACMPETLPRQEALLRETVDTGRAMGLRDLRAPRPVVLMEPETASWQVPRRRCFRLALLCGATAALSDEQLAVARHTRQPKASALRWCLDAIEARPAVACSSSICLFLGSSAIEDDAPQAKRPKSSSCPSGPDGTVRIRHILFSHQQLKLQDSLARREGAARSAQEAEEAALRALETLQEPGQAELLFPRLCRELSDCQSAAQPGKLSGDLGWVGRGQQGETALEDVMFSLAVNELSDVVGSSRGVHIFQRLA